MQEADDQKGDADSKGEKGDADSRSRKGDADFEGEKGSTEMKNKKEDIIRACHFASPLQVSRSSHWNNAHAEECFMDQGVKQWTDTPRADAIEHFQAPRDGDQSCVDVLRYRFADDANIAQSINIHRPKLVETPIKSQKQQWREEVSRLWTYTLYDSRAFVAPSAEGCKSNIVKTLHQVMEGQELDMMLQTCSTAEADDDLEGWDSEDFDDIGIASDEDGDAATKKSLL